MTQLLLRLRADGGSEWLDADGVVHAGWPAPHAERVVVLVPAEDVLLLDVARIAGSERQWSQALPFVVEEQLVLPIESQHVAWWRGSRDDRICVAVVARTRLDGWLAQLHAADVAPDMLLPESLALPWHPERPTLLVDGGHCVLRLGESSVLAGDAGEITAFAAHTESMPAVEAWLVGDGSSPLPAQEEHAVAHALHAFSTHGAGLNLLQGDYVPRGRSNGLARRWRRAAVLAGIALLLALLHPLLDRHKLASKVTSQHAEMAQLYRRAVPSATSVDDPARQLQSALAARGLAHGDGLMNLLAQIAPALAADDRLSLDSLDYRERQLELVVQAGSVADLDALRQRLTRTGLNAEIASTTPGTRGVQGRLRLGAAP
jgi:general secretion pathway protein L